ncbi:DUF2254 domain-containing protein [Amorphus orientalis]|uniref:Membrane protein n=1 Tax=Amorphus orientalis TaxID=649198 RepID=A0AAE4AUK8_9HYPH|nr:DUF2254 domain-containing protein [Amorphus orientalis]MDQ0317520.1 putative membrane protein [Amorphus orientalis]
MLSKWQWIFRQFTRKLWVRATLFAVLAVVSALAATVIAPFVPPEMPTTIGADAVDDILNILASSMLAVTTFSLSVMVSHYSMVTNNVTPRATRLLFEDATAQNALGTFIGTFLFSLVGIIALSTDVYGDRGRVILFAVTLLVIFLIVITMLRWIDHLSRLGRIEEPTERVENVTAAAFRTFADYPSLGGRMLTGRDAIPAAAVPVHARRIGYVRHVDTKGLSDVAETHGLDVYVVALPGSFVHPKAPLAFVIGDVEEAAADLRVPFDVSDVRTYDSDPRFGLSVLAEIASRALSPGINDPGTAIDIIGRAVRVLAGWQQEAASQADAEILYPRLWLPALEMEELFDHVFSPIARDGAGHIEVQIQLQKAFASLAEIDPAAFAAVAREQSRLALARSDRALDLEEEKARVREAALAARG